MSSRRPSSALTNVPLQWPGAGCTTMPGRLVDDQEVRILIDDAEWNRLGDHGALTRRREHHGTCVRPTWVGSSPSRDGRRQRRSRSRSMLPLGCGRSRPRGDQHVEAVAGVRGNYESDLASAGRLGRNYISGTGAACRSRVRSSIHSTHASRNAPVVTAMSATLNVGQRWKPTPMSMKSTTPARRSDAVDEVPDRSPSHESDREGTCHVARRASPGRGERGCPAPQA